MVRWGQGRRGKEARHLALSTGRRCSRKEEEAGRERNNGVKTEDGVMETCTHVTSTMDQCWPWAGLGRAGPKRDPGVK